MATEHKGDKWFCEKYGKGKGQDKVHVEIKPEDIKETVYIGQCDGAVVQISGKFKSLVINNCKNTGIVFDDLIACCEVINSKKIQVQPKGLCSNFQIDKSDGVTVFLSEASQEAMIRHAQSSGVNIMIPKGDELSEHGLPEMFCSQFDKEKGKMVSTIAVSCSAYEHGVLSDKQLN